MYQARQDVVTEVRLTSPVGLFEQFQQDLGAKKVISHRGISVARIVR